MSAVAGMTGRVAEMRKGPVWVTDRRAHREHNESAFPPKAAVIADMRNDRVGPRPDSCTAANCRSAVKHQPRFDCMLLCKSSLFFELISIGYSIWGVRIGRILFH